MSIAFVLFMVFIFKGYHQSKLEQRENKENTKKDS
jgi:hypothetical protein